MSIAAYRASRALVRHSIAVGIGGGTRGDLAFIGNPVAVDVLARPLLDVLCVGDAVVVTVVVADAKVLDVLFAVVVSPLGDVSAHVIGDHVVVVPELLLIGPAHASVRTAG